MKSDRFKGSSINSRDALILVDLQNDFLPGGALAVPGGDHVVPIANRMQKAFQHVFATRDWHPPEHGSFAASHPGAQPGDVVQLAGLSQVLWPVHCVQGSYGAELAATLERHAGRHDVLKGENLNVDSYSAFFDNGRQRQTRLDTILREVGIQRLFIMGLATDYCVKFTALDAVSLGYDVCLIADGCRGVDLRPGDVENAKQTMQSVGVTIVSSQAILSLECDPRNDD